MEKRERLKLAIVRAVFDPPIECVVEAIGLHPAESVFPERTRAVSRDWAASEVG